jgi:colicin import membrane protein
MAQQAPPELDGAPGSRAVDTPPPLKIPAKPAAKKTTTPDVAKAQQAKLSQQAEAQKAEQARLARQADELKAQQARLDARAAEIAAEEKRIEKLRVDTAAQQAAEDKRLTQLRADAQAKLAAQPAELTRKQQEASRAAAAALEPPTESEAPPPAPDTRDQRQPSSPRLVFAAARRSCTWAGEQAARARDYDDAQYDDEPRLYQRDGWELRGRMRLQDRGGYRLVDTVCEVDDAGEVQRFALLR